ncbi:MAG: hypothetical protein HY704_10810 [Gemmatimonadetes bacterium]|nr:hypothetical protein [Gemmatimonadota bacterium]
MALLRGDALLAEPAALRYGFDSQGRIVLEAKDETKVHDLKPPHVSLTLFGVSDDRLPDTHGGAWVQALRVPQRAPRPAERPRLHIPTGAASP